MLSAVGVSVSRGAQVVLDGVDLSVGPRSRIGIVGPNGIGKTTFLRVLAGLQQPDAGRVERSPGSLQVGYLPQELDAGPEEVLRDFLARRTGVAAAEAALDAATEVMGADPSDANVSAYTEALDAFLALGGDDLPARMGSVLADVGLPEDRLDLPVGALSGGQQARTALAAVLLSRFDVFLLDEPTNDLDFAGLDRLERFLDALPGGVVVVSHDRAFLDRTITRVLEIEDGTHAGAEYAGTWSDWMEARAVARRQAYSAYEGFVDQKSQLKERIREQRSWSETGAMAAKRKPKDNDKAQRGFFINKTEKQAGKVRISEKALARLDANAVDKPFEPWELQLRFGGGGRSGDRVASLQHAVVERGTFRLGPVDLDLGWAERLAVTGPNGGGKSTLLGALLGTFPLAGGTRWLGPGVVVGTLDQRRSSFAGDGEVLRTFRDETGLEGAEARSLLAKLGLGADHVHRRGADLSPGERTRALLGVLMARGVNLLVLDEPTNHLDVPAIEQLEQALDAFDGTVVLVSHDRRLLDAFRATRRIAVDAGRAVPVP